MEPEQAAEESNMNTALPQTALTLDDENQAMITIRPERNLEKWPIWEPSNSRHQMQERMLQREIRLPDGSVAVARVKVGFTNNGALTTEDQKTCYALFRIWEEQGKPKGGIQFSRQQLVRVLKRSWGSKTNKAITESLLRLRFTPFEWERSYFDSARQEILERVDTFTILSELKLFRRTRGDKVTAEDSYFEFNERILSNLLSGFTRPIYLETILRFKSEIAQILYTHLDLIMADKTRYERRTKELFAELGIDGVTYRYPSKRAQILQLALKELQDVPVPTGLLSVTLERTVDDTDFKIVARKTRRASKTKKEKTLSLFAPGVSESPPVVTQIINAPVEKARRSVNKSAGDKSSSVSRNVAPSTDAPEGADSASTQADAQIRHFYQIFFQTGETARPTPRELALAKAHIARLGVEKSRYLVQFARREAKTTNFNIANYGGIAAYEGRAVGEYDTNEKLRHDSLHERVRENHRQRYFPDYLAYLTTVLQETEQEPTPTFRAFLEDEEKARQRLLTGKMARTSVAERTLKSFDDVANRVERFREFLRVQMERGKRLENVLSFWEWDARLNPDALPR